MRTNHTSAPSVDRPRPDEHLGWVGRPTLARLLRAAIALAPVVFGILVTYLTAPLLPVPIGPLETTVWFAGLVALSVVVMVTTERLGRVLLPLTLLMRLTLVFPDEAPSRFALALRTSSTKELARTVAEVKARGLGSTEAEAAENLLVLVAALSDHDRLTRGHSERVRAYSELIGEELHLSESDRSKLRWAGLLHDVGKLWVPEEILSKPGKLTDEEFDLIKKHPEWGAQLVAPLADWLGPWVHAVGQHHERWDGGGYPNGLAGTEIALAARIVSVADVFDVMTSVRSYKSASNAVEARAEISRCAGTQFDPAVVRAFLNIGLGRVRRTMWPLTMLGQVPQLIGVITAPVAGPAMSVSLAAASMTAGAVASPALELDLGRETPAALALVDEPTIAGEASQRASSRDPEPEAAAAVGPTIDGERPSSDRPAGIPTTVSSPGDVSLPEPSSSSSTTVLTVPTERTSAPPPTTSTTSTTTTTTSTSIPTTTTTTSMPTTTTTTTSMPTTTTASGQEDAGSDPYECLVQNDFDPTNCVLAGADLSGADLRDVDFDGVDLTGTNLSNANLRDASLEQANLAGSVLSNADLREASLEDAILAGANVDHAKFRDASLEGANLAGVDFSKVDLRDADLDGANIDGTNFFSADLRGTDLSGATGTPSSWDQAKFGDTVCPDGNTSNDSCW